MSRYHTCLETDFPPIRRYEQIWRIRRSPGISPVGVFISAYAHVGLWAPGVDHLMMRLCKRVQLWSDWNAEDGFGVFSRQVGYVLAEVHAKRFIADAAVAVFVSISFLSTTTSDIPSSPSPLANPRSFLSYPILSFFFLFVLRQ